MVPVLGDVVHLTHVIGEHEMFRVQPVGKSEADQESYRGPASGHFTHSIAFNFASFHPQLFEHDHRRHVGPQAPRRVRAPTRLRPEIRHQSRSHGRVNHEGTMHTQFRRKRTAGRRHDQDEWSKRRRTDFARTRTSSLRNANACRVASRNIPHSRSWKLPLTSLTHPDPRHRRQRLRPPP